MTRGEVAYKDEWLTIVEDAPKPKTKVFTVGSNCSNSVLGEIKWYPPWRHYCFFPDEYYETIYSDRCLMALSKFITKINNEHKNKKKGSGER